MEWGDDESDPDLQDTAADIKDRIREEEEEEELVQSPKGKAGSVAKRTRKAALGRIRKLADKRQRLQPLCLQNWPVLYQNLIF